MVVTSLKCLKHQVLMHFLISLPHDMLIFKGPCFSNLDGLCADYLLLIGFLKCTKRVIPFTSRVTLQRMYVSRDKWIVSSGSLMNTYAFMLCSCRFPTMPKVCCHIIEDYIFEQL